jgi:hypothetical protein
MMNRMTRPGLLAAIAVFASAFTVRAANITYEINRTVSGGTVTGSITTDGVIGTLVTADILGFDLELQDGFGLTLDLTGPTAGPPVEGVEILGSDLTASATALSFNYDGTDGGLFLIQENGFGNGNTYYCDGAFDQATCIAGDEADVPGSSLGGHPQFANRAGNIELGSVPDSGSPTPEPASVILTSTSLLCLALFARKRAGCR